MRLYFHVPCIPIQMGCTQACIVVLDRQDIPLIFHIVALLVTCCSAPLPIPPCEQTLNASSQVSELSAHKSQSQMALSRAASAVLPCACRTVSLKSVLQFLELHSFGRQNMSYSGRMHKPEKSPPTPRKVRKHLAQN